MQIKYVCPYWGSGEIPIADFIDKIASVGYNGIEIDTSGNEVLEKDLLTAIAKTRKQGDFIFIAQQWLPPAKESFEKYKQRFTERLEHLVTLKPDFINSHTGKDYFSFEQNCELIEFAFELSAKSGTGILHETHRGRFSFHLPRTLTYLKKYPGLKLVADFSHWCAVAESLLEDQEEMLELVIPHCPHIHARVGYEHSPQVNDFRAPEWKAHVDRFVGWWKKILAHHKTKEQITICPEFGPVSYMPTEPFTQRPLANQWEENFAMMKMLTDVLVLQ